MVDEKPVLLSAHRNNIRRYQRLLKTELTEFERRFIEKRLSEERSAIENVAASPFGIPFQVPTRVAESSTTLVRASSNS
jgi:hypothetical protein